MVSESEVLDMLKGIGLNLYERKLYLALLNKRIASAGELSEIANVPRSRSYDVLESLADKGFVIVQNSKPIKYVALPPSDAMDRVKENLNKRHEERIERIDRLRDSGNVNHLQRIYDENFDHIHPQDMVGTLKGRSAINQQLQSIFKNAKKNISIITTEEGLKDLHSNHFRVLKKAAKKGVKVEILSPSTDGKLVSEFSSIGQTKRISNPAGRVCTIDGKHLIFALTDDKTHHTQDVAFWAESPHAVKDVVSHVFKSVA